MSRLNCSTSERGNQCLTIFLQKNKNNKTKGFYKNNPYLSILLHHRAIQKPLKSSGKVPKINCTCKSFFFILF